MATDELHISSRISVPMTEIEFTSIRAQGAGGQNVNKVSSAIHLRFDIARSSLPDSVKSRLLSHADSRINKSGEIVIKAQRHRTRELNRTDALSRLQQLIYSATRTQAARKATRPTRGSNQRRLNKKSQRSQTKQMRRKVTGD